jgi:hypothetical protein
MRDKLRDSFFIPRDNPAFSGRIVDYAETKRQPVNWRKIPITLIDPMALA